MAKNYDFSKAKFDTLAVQAGYPPEENPQNEFGMSMPIVTATAFDFQNVDHAAALFDLTEPGHIYTRLSNPTNAVLERTVSALEGAPHIGHDLNSSVAFASGQAATTAAILNICKAGDQIICAPCIYGGTHNLFVHTLSRLGIDTIFAEGNEPHHFAKAIESAKSPRLVFCEQLCNPTLDVLDIPLISDTAHYYGLPLFADNTIPTPALFKPVDWGADIVVHSSTKGFSNGASSGGVVVDLGTFPWNKPEDAKKVSNVVKTHRKSDVKNSHDFYLEYLLPYGLGSKTINVRPFSEFTEPDESYHGIVYFDACSTACFKLRLLANVLRDTGGVAHPFGSWTTMQYMPSLSARMERISNTALTLAKYLENNTSGKIKPGSVRYPALESSKYHELQKILLPKGCGSLVSFELDPALGRPGLTTFAESLHIPTLTTHLCTSNSVITIPSLTTHRQVSADTLKRNGISETFVRFSVGFEDPADIIQDIEQAFTKI